MTHSVAPHYPLPLWSAATGSYPPAVPNTLNFFIIIIILWSFECKSIDLIGCLVGM